MYTYIKHLGKNINVIQVKGRTKNYTVTNFKF